MHYKKPSLLDAPVNKKTRHNLERLLEENHDAFTEGDRQIGTTPLLKMSIDTSHMPIAKKLMLWPSNIMTASEMRLTNCSRQVSLGNATPVGHPPIVVVPKGDGGKRLCMDFRALNAISRTYVWPMPRVEDFFAKLGKAKFFTTLNLRSGYHHIALDDDAIKKTAFVTPLGKYE